MTLSYILLSFSSLLSAGASVLLKAAVDSHHVNLFPPLRDDLTLRLLALGAFGLSFFCYAGSLTRLQLQVAYPSLVAMTMLWLYLYNIYTRQHISWTSIAGAILIVSGIILISLKHK